MRMHICKYICMYIYAYMPMYIEAMNVYETSHPTSTAKKKTLPHIIYLYVNIQGANTSCAHDPAATAKPHGLFRGSARVAAEERPSSSRMPAGARLKRKLLPGKPVAVKRGLLCLHHQLL